MYIDKFAKHGGYIYLDDCSYDTDISLIGSGILGFCGCGDPEEAIKYVHKGLQLVNIKKDIHFTEWEKELNKVFTDLGSIYFMWYFLNNKELTEHGSCVPGWLTTKGEELLSDLNELYKDNLIHK